MATVTSADVPAPAPRRPLSLARLSDELLARQAARGSDRAFTVLYERYHQPLYRYCRAIVRNDGDAQDVLQSTFTAALSALRREMRSAPLRPWLYRIARNESITLLRRRTRESDHEITGAAAPVVSSAEDEAAGRARWALLLADLGALPERQRSALLLREMSGLSHEEIAIALGTNVGAAKQAIFEARQGLMELAEGRAMSCDDVRRRLSAGDRRVLRGRRVRAHLRDCGGCAAFAAAIPERTAGLRALAPALPASAGGVVLTRALGAATAHGGSGAAAGTAAVAGAAGKLAGTALTWKALSGVALVAGAAVGVSGIEHALRQDHAHAQPTSVTAVHQRAALIRRRAAGPPKAVRPAGPARRGDRVRGDAAAHGSPIAVVPAGAPAVAEPVPTGTDHGKAAASRGLGAAAAPGHVKAKAGVPRGHAPAAHGRGSASKHGRSSTHRSGSSRTSSGSSAKRGSAPGKARARYQLSTAGGSKLSRAAWSRLIGAGASDLLPVPANRTKPLTGGRT